jgi:hypothetical protein
MGSMFRRLSMMNTLCVVFEGMRLHPYVWCTCSMHHMHRKAYTIRDSASPKCVVACVVCEVMRINRSVLSAVV